MKNLSKNSRSITLIRFLISTIFLLGGLIWTLSSAEAGDAPGDCNCWVGARSTYSWTSTAGTPCTDVARCTEHCKSEAPSFTADPNDTRGDCVGVSESPAETPPTTTPAGTPSAGPPPAQELVNPIGGTAENPAGVTSVSALIANIIKAVLGVIGAIALFMFFWGGFGWLTSGGNPDKIKQGKDTLVWATIGLLIIFASYTLVETIFKALGALP